MEDKSAKPGKEGSGNLNPEKIEQLKREAMALYVRAVRNGPIENIHADGRISDKEMKEINKNAVNYLYWLLCLKEANPEEYEKKIEFGARYTRNWDDPEVPKVVQVTIP